MIETLKYIKCTYCVQLSLRFKNILYELDENPDYVE